MNILHYASTAMVASLIALAPAVAAPASPANTLGQAIESPVIQIQYNQNPDARPNRRPAPKYRAGGRYRAAPSGWHRHGARPSDWQTRGCILVGSVWFCP